MSRKGQYIYEYPHPAITADCVVFGYDTKEIKVLLIKRGKEKEASSTAYVGEWALPGGFMDVMRDRSIVHTAIRELEEETNLSLDVDDFKEVGSFSDINRDPRERVVTIAHYALVKMSQVQASTDADNAEWFPLGAIP
ncbi:MAG: NUDIX hydrolase, partial [Bacteroidales bacterium]|nr:NUDIX hydrolase [Bacteroidales bacterium]